MNLRGMPVVVLNGCAYKAYLTVTGSAKLDLVACLRFQGIQIKSAREAKTLPSWEGGGGEVRRDSIAKASFPK